MGKNTKQRLVTWLWTRLDVHSKAMLSHSIGKVAFRMRDSWTNVSIVEWHELVLFSCGTVTRRRNDIHPTYHMPSVYICHPCSTNEPGNHTCGQWQKTALPHRPRICYFGIFRHQYAGRRILCWCVWCQKWNMLCMRLHKMLWFT